MARGLLISLALVFAGWGCADAPQAVVEPPLFVFSSYPASGATMWRSDLTEVAFTLSMDLGSPEHGRTIGARAFRLEGPEGQLAVIEEGLINVAYDPDAQLLRVVIASDVREGLPLGRYTATLSAGLVTEAGVAMPIDFATRFRLTAPPPPAE